MAALPRRHKCLALRSQIATLNAAGGGRGQHCNNLPYAFTEHDATMSAMQGDLAKRLDELGHQTEALLMSHDNFSRNQFKQVFDAPRKLMTTP